MSSEHARLVTCPYRIDEFLELNRLETIPVEIQLNILRKLIPTNGQPIYFDNDVHDDSPIDVQECHDGANYHGITGVFRVSKHISNLALGVFYGENVFYVAEDEGCGFIDSQESDLNKVRDLALLRA